MSNIKKDKALINTLNKKYKDKKVPYMGNIDLPSDKSQFEYDKDRIEVIRRCKEDILYFAENFFYIINPDEGKQKITLHDFQKESLITFKDHRKSIMCCARQIGKSTVITIYALWLVTFFEYQRVVIVANKEKTAQYLLGRVQLAYKELPDWFKPPTSGWGKQGTEFANGSEIAISSTSSDAIRGMSVNCLLVDEMAFIDSGIIEAFWSAVYPTISASKKAKVLIASTPNGIGNRFQKLWDAANEEDSDWGKIKITWRDMPDRNEEWARQERLVMGDDKFEQEHECKFLENGESVLPEDLYTEIQKNCIKPRLTFDDDCYKIFKEPDIENRIYCAGVDIAEGVGENNSTINVMDITELTQCEQVATYACNTIGPHEFAKKLNEIMIHWGKPPLAIERNNSGGGVVINQMDKTYNYPNLLNFATKQGRLDYGHLKGVTSSTNTKYHGVMNLFYWLKNHRRIILRDIETLKEINTFVRHKNEKWAKKNDTFKDDRVDALIWSMICIHELCVNQFYNVLIWDDNKKPLQITALYEAYGKRAGFMFGTEENNWGAYAPVVPYGGNDPFIGEMNSLGWLLPTQDRERNWQSYSPM